MYFGAHEGFLRHAFEWCSLKSKCVGGSNFCWLVTVASCPVTVSAFDSSAFSHMNTQGRLCAILVLVENVQSYPCKSTRLVHSGCLYIMVLCNFFFNSSVTSENFLMSMVFLKALSSWQLMFLHWTFPCKV